MYGVEFAGTVDGCIHGSTCAFFAQFTVRKSRCVARHPPQILAAARRREPDSGQQAPAHLFGVEAACNQRAHIRRHALPPRLRRRRRLDFCDEPLDVRVEQPAGCGDAACGAVRHGRLNTARSAHCGARGASQRPAGGLQRRAPSCRDAGAQEEALGARQRVWEMCGALQSLVEKLRNDGTDG